MKASIVIRTKNEQKRIGEVLDKLVSQSEKDFEVIIVDSGSTDKTLEVVKSFNGKLNIKIDRIQPESFTYPYACNFGAKKASGDYLVYISGHSVPVNQNWLKSGLESFKDQKVAGVYGSVLPSADATVFEWFIYLPGFFTTKKVANLKKMGIMGSTNAIYRKDLWLEHHFDESYVEGGEDGEWAHYFINRGFNIIQDPKFAVYHSHGLWLLDYLEQRKRWQRAAEKFTKQYQLN